MDRQQIGLKLTISALGLPFELDAFEKRLILQKAVYLAQAGGVNLGYYHHWYLYGPYCPSLTRDAYTIWGELSEGVDESESWKLDAPSQEKLRQLGKIISRGDTQQKRRNLELLASVHFLCERKQVPKESPEEIVSALRRFKKDFTVEEVKGALSELREYGLLSR